MTVHIRRAGALHAGAMADLLNAIIARGGTTEMTDPVTREMMIDKMARRAEAAAWHIAEDENGALLGFQWIAPWDDLPETACDIATFVRVGQTGLGVGSALFEATKAAARALGYDWINATIRTDNEGGLIYYQSRGFEDYKTLDPAPLADGFVVGRRCKRFDLRR